MSEELLSYLLEKFFSATCTPAENARLNEWYQQFFATHQVLVQEGSVEANELTSMMLTQFRSKIKLLRPQEDS